MLNFFFLTDSRLTSLRKFIVWDFVMSSLTMFRQVLKIIFTFGIKIVCVCQNERSTLSYILGSFLCVYVFIAVYTLGTRPFLLVVLQLHIVWEYPTICSTLTLYTLHIFTLNRLALILKIISFGNCLSGLL